MIFPTKQVDRDKGAVSITTAGHGGAKANVMNATSLGKLRQRIAEEAVTNKWATATMVAMHVGTHKHEDANNITDNVIFQVQHPNRSAAMPQTKTSQTTMGPFTMMP